MKMKKKDYQYIDPIAPPTNPNYKEFLEMRQDQIFSNEEYKTFYYDEKNDHDDNIINNQNIDTNHKIVTKKNEDEKEESKTPENIPIHHQNHLSNTSLDENEIANINNNQLKLNMKKPTKTKSIRNQFAFWSAIAGGAVIIFYLVKFFYQTQTNSYNSPNNNNNDNNNGNSNRLSQFTKK